VKLVGVEGFRFGRVTFPVMGTRHVLHICQLTDASPGDGHKREGRGSGKSKRRRGGWVERKRSECYFARKIDGCRTHYDFVPKKILSEKDFLKIGRE